MTTYRDDHEAALARLAALEAEHAKLVAENERLRAPKKPAAPYFTPTEGFPSKITIVMLAFLAGLSITFIVYLFVKGDA
jgi:hypothetical protein